MPDDNTQNKLSAIPFRSAPDGVAEIYCNFFSVNWTLFDVRIRLAQLIPAPNAVVPAAGPIEHIAEERGAVTLAWPEIKALRDALHDAVERFEKANGTIQTLKMPS